MEKESILVIGATGASGLAFIAEALSSPNPPKNLTLYVRSPSKLPPEYNTTTTTNNNPHKPIITISEGSLTSYDTLSQTLRDNKITTVISFLGAYMSFTKFLTRDKSTPIADSFPTLLRAMKDNGVKRLFALSTPAHWVEGQDVAPASWSWKMSLYLMMPRIVVPQGNEEMRMIAKRVIDEAGDADSDEGRSIEWTIFRVPHLTDQAADLPVWAGFVGPEHKGSLDLSRRSQARWLLKEIEERKWVRKAPFLGNY